LNFKRKFGLESVCSEPALKMESLMEAVNPTVPFPAKRDLVNSLQQIVDKE
jgi:hypothetical protein